MCSCWGNHLFSNFKAPFGIAGGSVRLHLQPQFPSGRKIAFGLFQLPGGPFRLLPGLHQLLPGASGGSSSSANCSFEVRGCSAAASLALLDSKTSADSGYAGCQAFPWFLPRSILMGLWPRILQRGSISFSTGSACGCLRLSAFAAGCGGLWLKGPPKSQENPLPAADQKSCSRPLIRVSSPEAAPRSTSPSRVILWNFFFLCPKFFIPWQLHHLPYARR